MKIQEMSHQDCLEVLGRARLGRLACSQTNQPYITPGYFAFEDGYLYGFTTAGQKITWMRANPLVCVEFEEIQNASAWASVIVTGRFEELPPTPEHDAYRTRAYAFLQRHPLWWEPGYVKTELKGGPRPLDPLYFRIIIDQLTGRRGVPEAAPLASGRPRVSLLSRILGGS